MRRQRSQGELTDYTFDVSGVNRDCSDGSFSKTAEDMFGEYRVMNDVVVPQYLQRSARGEVFVNEMTSYRTVREEPSGTPGSFHDTILYAPNTCLLNFTYPGGFNTYHAFGYNENALVKHLDVPLDIQSAFESTATEARAGVADPTFAGATFVAEIGDALKLFTSPVRSLEQLFHRALKDKRRKGNPRVRNSTLFQFLSDNWLYYRYGIMPIVYDLEDASDALTTLEGWSSPRFVSRGRQTLTGNNLETQVGSPSVAWNISRDVETSREVTVRTGVLYELAEDNTFGVTLGDVPSALWEIVPFSFVVDWFWNVSDYIRAISPKVGVKQLGEWTTYSDKKATSAYGYSTGRTLTVNITYTSDPTSLESFETEEKWRKPVMAKSGVVWKPTDFIGTVTGRKRIIDAFALTLSLLNKS